MKKLLLGVFAILCLQAQAQLPPNNLAIEVLSDFQGNNWVLKARNNDFCDYSIRVDFTTTIGFSGPSSPYTGVIRRGEGPLFTLKWDGSSSAQPRFSFSVMRGNIFEKPNVDFVYALPVKQGDSLRVATQGNMDYTLKFDLSNASDTVYACRGGVVCDNSLTDLSSKGSIKIDRSNKTTIYHQDGTMADYTIDKEYLVKMLVFPGNNVNMGDPIAVVKSASKTRPNGKTIEGKDISVGIYFLDKNKFNTAQTSRQHTGFVPIFHTAQGDVKLAAKTTYVGGITDQMTTSDMSKREKERYLKNKAKK